MRFFSRQSSQKRKMKGDMQLPSDMTTSVIEPSIDRHSDLIPKLNEAYSNSFVDGADKGQLQINKNGAKKPKKQKKLGQGMGLPQFVKRKSQKKPNHKRVESQVFDFEQ